jgi:glycosyltransferase involved in cell wall biosynthesis/GT2 family glycosyltransferase
MNDMMDKPDRAYLKHPVGDADAVTSIRPLAVLIVAHRDHDMLAGCLSSVAEHLPELSIYVYEDSGVEYPGRHELGPRYPAVHWVYGTARLGLAAAFNALVDQAPSGADLLLLHTDTRVVGPLNRTRQLLHDRQVAAVSPLTNDNTEPRRPMWDIATRRQTLTRSLTAAAGYTESLRHTPISLKYARQPSESEDIGGYLEASCLAVNRAAWNAIGGFDEEFFLHGEAADWQDRARSAGWRILLADEIGVERDNPVGGERLRKGGGSTKDSRDLDLIRANTALLLEHQYSARRADMYLAGTSLLNRLQRSKRPTRRPVISANRTRLPAIVIVTNRLVYGGAERQKALLATELDRRGYNVTIVCIQRFGPVVSEIPPTVRVVRQPWWAPIVDIPAGPAVLVSGDTNTETGFGTLWRAAASDRRWLVAAHVPPADDEPIYSRPLTAAMSRADGFIVLAQRHWDMLISQHPLRGPRFVAPNGVTSIGNPVARIRPVDQPPHLVMLSRIVEHKNPHLLIEALSDLADMPWLLSIFGDGPDRKMLEAKTPVGLRDRVHWRGWSAGPGPALADADLLCVPSRSEAFPLVILEAMARAIPVAASAVCAVPEMLDFGKTGYVVEPISVSGWREQLHRILGDPGALPSVGQRGYERMRTHYTVQAMTDAYVNAITAVL